MNISSENIKLQMASLRGQIFSTLLDSTGNGKSGTADFAELLGMKTAEVGADPGANLGAAGRNLSLRDPESAYQMMSQINRFEVSFKAQFSELTQMGREVEDLETLGGRLAEIDTTSSNTEIADRLQAFVDRYNAWEDRFDDTVAAGGVLRNVQAAEVSLYELEQSIKNIFNGAADGIRGLADLGIEIDPVTRQATFDVARLESVLATNRNGVVNAIDQFSANFAKSADLLNAEGNFIQNALGNRSRAVDYINGNRSNLQAEFGTGDAYQPSGATAKAVAAYNAAFGIA